MLVVVDYFSRYYETEITCSTTSAEIIKSLEDVQAESPTQTRLSAMYIETDGGKKKNAVPKRPALADVETDCAKFRTATDNYHLQDHLVIRNYQRSSKTLAKDESLSNFVCSCSDVGSQIWGCGFAWH